MREILRTSSLLLLALSSVRCGDDGGEPSQLDDDTIVYPTADWLTAEPAKMGFDVGKLEQLAVAADANDSHCALVTRKGRIVGEWYWDGWTADSKQNVHSVTKSVSSTLVGIAQDRGLLRIDEPASKYIPSWAGTPSADITIEHLLSNVSGREWDFLTDYVQMAGGAADKTGFAVALGQDRPPGTFWEYNNSAIQTLERVLKTAVGKDVAVFAREALFEPLGMKTELSHDDAGNALMFGDMQASCRDLARFGYLFLRGGQWAGGQRIVSKAWVDAATTKSQDLNEQYGYLWWLNREGHYVRPSAPNRHEGDGKWVAGLPESVFSALGMNGQIIMVDPEHEIVVTRIGGDPTTIGAILSGGDPVGSSVVLELGTALAAAVKR